MEPCRLAGIPDPPTNRHLPQSNRHRSSDSRQPNTSCKRAVTALNDVPVCLARWRIVRDILRPIPIPIDDPSSRKQQCGSDIVTQSLLLIGPWSSSSHNSFSTRIEEQEMSQLVTYCKPLTLHRQSTPNKYPCVLRGIDKAPIFNEVGFSDLINIHLTGELLYIDGWILLHTATIKQPTCKRIQFPAHCPWPRWKRTQSRTLNSRKRRTPPRARSSRAEISRSSVVGPSHSYSAAAVRNALTSVGSRSGSGSVPSARTASSPRAPAAAKTSSIEAAPRTAESAISCARRRMCSRASAAAAILAGSSRAVHASFRPACSCPRTTAWLCTRRA